MPRWAEDDSWPGGANRSNSPRQLSSFADRFVHLRTGNPAANNPALLATVLADGTNLGLAWMADASRGLGYHHLVNVAQWHISDDNYVAARAAIVNAHHRHPMAAIWDDGTTSSSDGQYFRAGGRAGPGGSVNAKYGIDPGAVLYTHVSGHYGPFCTRVISATMSEALYGRIAPSRAPGHCQSKFYTACLRLRAERSSAVFAHQSPTCSVGFDAENGLYLFALTVP